MKQFLLLCMLLTTCTSISAKKGMKSVSFRFYGSTWSVRISDKLHFAVPDTTYKNVFNTIVIEQHITETFNDCISLKKEKRLNDWAYLCMLDSLAATCFGNGNEATLMKAYLFAKSGYKIKIGRDSVNTLYLLYCSRSTIYGKQYFDIGGDYFFCDKNFGSSLSISPYQNEGRPVSFDMRQQPVLEYRRTEAKTLESKTDCFPPLKIKVSVNQNLLDFYAQYPTTYKNYDFMTRWAMIANVPLDQDVQRQIYPQIRKELEGLSQRDAVERLLTFAQTAVEWGWDDDVWGYDRAFFAEETLFYPFNDSEDRVILLSRLVRDLIGLEVVIIFYPGHLALAVHFDEDVMGAAVTYNGDRFIICDPTFIGSWVGQVVPTFKDEDPQRIILLYK